MTEQQAPSATARQLRITSRWDSSRVLFTFDAPEGLESGLWLRAALEAAAESDANLSGANLSDANLSDANLSDANLRDANLSDANLRGANLSDANLRGANLRGANLSDANLSDANLRDANLRDANLRGANLRGANLSDANLRGANLRGANLRDANLSPIKADVFDVLLRAPREVADLRLALVEGRVDGSVYEGACACLVGTIANARGEKYDTLGSGLSPNSSRPAENFFFAISKGHTPENNSASKLVVEWIDEFDALMRAAAPTFIDAGDKRVSA